MPHRTALRRVSTVMVGVLFAVVLVCSGASARHAVSERGTSVAGIHTSSSKAIARALDAKSLEHLDPVPLPLATGPATDDKPPASVADSSDERSLPAVSTTSFTTSDRAPPAS